MSDTPTTSATAPSPSDRRSLLEIGALITLVAFAFAAVAGVIAVLDTGSASGGLALGFGIALLIFFSGATIACSLACLVRRRAELLSLGALIAACLSLDLIVLAIWLDIDNDAYAKLAGIVAIWSFFALVVLGLTLAVTRPERLALALYTGAVAAAVVGAVMATALVLRAGDDDVGEAAPIIGTLPLGDDGLLQVLGAMLVLLAAFWFSALAASRLPDQTLKRTLTTSPSSTT